VDYKQTLNLPKTAFPMKGNLPQAEPKMLARWEEERLHERIQTARKGRSSFILHDGPPYANGDIHIGHALNKILKDIIVRHRTMQGRRAPYVPGWDCHGLPIEHALMKELRVTKHQVKVNEFRKQARAYALKYVGIQRDQFKRLGVMGDWENPYLTLKPEFVAAELRVLKSLVEKGFVYRARKPVNWCWNCETALAEAEVEYENHASPSIYVKFELKAPEIGPKVYLVVWTTTPWTLMGNVAVALNPTYDYAVRKGPSGELWIMLKELPDSSRKALGLSEESHPVQRKISGKTLEGKTYDHPLGIRQGQVVLADYVSAEDGTGLVHIAPGFGAEDFAVGRQYKLDVVAPVDSQGKFIELPAALASLNGQRVQKANPAVIDLLRTSGHLVTAVEIQHQYPHCWRCHNPIIFRATHQWFLKVEHNDLRRKLLDAVEKQVTWVPPGGKERMAGMIKTRPDWCLSRQRLWGVPVPALVCADPKCGGAWLIPELIERFAEAAQSAPDGVDLWFTDAYKKWIPEGFGCLDCGGETFTQGTDILDVWFDSGVSHQGVLAQRKELAPPPADLYLEGSDQHRGWFQVSLITGVALNGQAPYRGVLTHGFVVDGQGRKMSKSLGNVIAPQKVIDSMGADVLRMWVASADYAEDVRISPEILSQTAETYRKIRNTIRFCLSNLSGFSPKEPSGLEKVQELDGWILSGLDCLVEEVTREYEDYAYHKVVKLIHEFCTIRLSNVYLDAIKDLLYTEHPSDPHRRSAQTALYAIANTLIRLLAPILPFTAEEAWSVLLGTEAQSVHLALWPYCGEFLHQDSDVDAGWEDLLKVRDQAMKELEQARAAGLIGDALEAELEIAVSGGAHFKFLKSKEDRLASVCIVSKLEVVQGSGPEPIVIRVRKSAHLKCERCWKRLSTVGQSPEHPGLCGRCVEVVRKLGQ